MCMLGIQTQAVMHAWQVLPAQPPNIASFGPEGKDCCPRVEAVTAPRQAETSSGFLSPAVIVKSRAQHLR